jgi:GAF domain-containing protein
MPEPVSVKPESHGTVEERLMVAFQKIERLYETLKRDDAAAFIVDLARELVPCEAAACALFSDGAEDLYIAAASGTAAGARLGERLPMSHGFLGFAIRSAQIAAVTEPARIYPQIDEVSRMHVSSVLAVPLTAGERSLGAVELLNAPSTEGFSSEDGDVLAYLCQSLGEHIVQSIEGREEG